MALNVLGRMKQQAQDGRRQPLGSDTACLAKRVRQGRFQLRKRALNLGRQVIEQDADPNRGIRQLALGRKCRPLVLRQLLVACVRKQPIDHAGHVLQVKIRPTRRLRGAPRAGGRETRAASNGLRRAPGSAHARRAAMKRESHRLVRRSHASGSVTNPEPQISSARMARIQRNRPSRCCAPTNGVEQRQKHRRLDSSAGEARIRSTAWFQSTI